MDKTSRQGAEDVCSYAIFSMLWNVIYRISDEWHFFPCSKITSILWLNPRARFPCGQIGLCCPLGISRVGFGKKAVSFWPYNRSVIDQACSVKMAEYCPRSFLRCSLISRASSWSIKTQRKNLANIRPSWPRACSLTHNYVITCLVPRRLKFGRKRDCKRSRNIAQWEL